MPSRLVEVKGNVLKWAREERALTLEQAATLVGIPVADLRDLEEERSKPNVTLFRRMADKYGYPYATLAMPSPLPPREPPKDFRTFAGRPPTTSLETMRAYSEAVEAQEAIAELAEEDSSLYARPRLPHATLNDDPAELAERERRRLDLKDATQLSEWKDTRTAYTALRLLLEKQGVFTFEKDMPKDDCRGFSVYEPSAIPLIVVSKQEGTPQAKSFTLLHEYAHLLLRESGLCDENRRTRMERFCNRFAASFLMPTRLVRSVLAKVVGNGRPIDAAVVREVARRLRVSQESLALRLEELQLAARGFYDAWKAARANEPPPVTKRKSGPVPWERRKLSELGQGFPSVVVQALKRSVVTRPEAFALLGSGLSSTVFDKMRRLLRI